MPYSGVSGQRNKKQKNRENLLVANVVVVVLSSDQVLRKIHKKIDGRL